jgi:predicted small metal-binding protein
MAENQQNKQGLDLRFRCADVADKSCQWEANGRNEDDILRQVEQHGREAHNIDHIDDNMRQKVRGAISRKAA